MTTAEFTPTKAAALRDLLRKHERLQDSADELLNGWVEADSKERRDEIIQQWYARLDDITDWEYLVITPRMVDEWACYVETEDSYAAFASTIRGRIFHAHIGRRAQ